MKYNKIITAVACCLGVAALCGCNDAKYDEIENRIYISEAAPSSTFTQQTVNLTVTGDMTTTLHVRVAQPVDQDIQVTLAYAPEALAT